MRILIASGIYPPDIGGPAQYARNLYETWKSQGHDVKVAAYRWERAFPPIVRHLFYLSKVIRKGWNADLILVLDTWSAAVPTMWACSLLRKRYIIRTGGDFLWESYTERTGEMVLFKDFYDTCIDKLSGKEKLIFRWGGDALRRASKVVFSTEWQKGIFEKAYKLDANKSCIVENFCGEREAPVPPDERIFIAGSRVINLKNIPRLKEAFEKARVIIKKKGLPDIELDTSKAMYGNFVEKIRHSYAVIAASLSEISPNMILDAIRLGVPFIVTREVGIARDISEGAVFIDPLNVDDIADKIVWLADPANREAQSKKVQSLSFTHSWEAVSSEILKVYEGIR